MMRGLLLAVLIAMLGAVAASAQPPAQPPAPIDPSRDPLADPYLRELVRRSRGNNAMLATSISDALRLKLDDFASQFLTALEARRLNAAETAELAARISAARLLRVVVEPQFTDAAKQQATAMLDALRTVNQSPQRLTAAIDNLKSRSVDTRLAAMRTLLAGGYESIERLALAAAREADSQARDELLRVMLRLGESGPEAVRQLAIYGDDSLRPGALAALIRLRDAQTRAVVAAAAHDPHATPAEKVIAETWLMRRYQTMPSREDAEAYLLESLSLQREAVSRVGDQDATTVLWTVGEDRASLNHTTVTAIDAAWRNVVDQARLLHRLGRHSAEAIQAGVAAELAYRYHLDPLLASEAGEEVAALWGEDAVSSTSIAQLIQAALDRDDLVVAVAAIELIDESMADRAHELMTTNSEVLTPLVAATLHSQPRLRYHAATAIGRLGFAHAYAGSSYVMQRWIEMVNLSREPVVLLVETRVEVAGQIERLLQSMGYRVEIVPTVEDAVLAVDAGDDLRFLISTTILPDRSSLELVDAVRRRPLGSDLAIILHGPTDPAVEMAVNDRRWAAPLVQVELPASAPGWSLILQPLEDLRPLPSLSAIERYDFRLLGADSLGRIASQPDAFAFYEFNKLSGAVASGALASSHSSTVAFGEPRLAVLSVAASRFAQSALADLAIRNDAAPERREAAADALLLSIRRDGVLLAGEDLLRLTRTRQSMDSETGRAIDRVLAVIGRRADVGGITAGSIVEEAPQPTDTRVSPPDI